MSGVLVVTNACAFYTAHAAAGARHPAFPTPSLGRKINANLGRIAPRDRERVFEFILLFENFEVDVCAKRSPGSLL